MALIHNPAAPSRALARIGIVLAVVSLLASSVAAAPTVHAAGAPAGLHVSGNQILDAGGGIVRLVGVNRSGTEYQCVHGFGIFEGPSDAASAQAIADWHVNAVRIPLNEDCWLGINGVPAAYAGANYQNAIANYITLLESHGLVPILELHWSAAGAVPAAGQHAMPDVDHSIAFWSQVADAYKGDLSVVFDLFNEPFPDNNQDSTAAWQCWRDGGASCLGLLFTSPSQAVPVPVPDPFTAAGMQDLVTAVRGTGSTNLILVGGVQYANAMSQWLAFKPVDPTGNLAAAWHVYNFTACKTVACWDSQVLPVLSSVALVATEIGQDACGSAFLELVIPWLDSHRTGYLPWAWDTNFGCFSLITDFGGTPTQPYGAAAHDHLALTPPLVTIPAVIPASASVGTPVSVGVIATDATAVTAAQVSVDDGAWHSMLALDGAFDGASEAATATFGASAVDVVAGEYHSCALLVDKTVRCWGENAGGQLGDGTKIDHAFSVPVAGLSDVRAIAAGYRHTCALLGDGTVQCWGNNSSGQLGDGTTVEHLAPAAVPGLSSIRAISSSYSNTCALRVDGTVWCWGNGSLSPVAVAGLAGATAISVGGFHTCAVLIDGTADCWGYNGDGELGDGTTTDRLSPVPVAGLANVTEISARSDHTCAVLGDGTVHCWGRNYTGQLGDGTTTDRLSPVAVTGLAGAIGVAAGDTHMCAVLGDGGVRCWGGNAKGELGDGSTTIQLTPVAVAGISGVHSASAGDQDTCALLDSGAIDCWGFDYFGELGDGTMALARYVPVGVAGFGPLIAGPHDICVRAVDSLGRVSSGTDCSTLTVLPVTIATRPGAPTAITAAAGPETASISWIAPTDDGGSPITEYTVTPFPSGQPVMVSGATTTVTVGLVDDTTYTFTVAATNAVGTGPRSAASSPVTPRANAAPPTTVAEVVPAQGTISTDPGNIGPTPSAPVTAAVTVPAGGIVTIAVGDDTVSPPAGFSFLGQQVVINAPSATVGAPLTLHFTLEGSLVAGIPLAEIKVIRTEGAGPQELGNCTGTLTATPDPCVAGRSLAGGDVQITVLTSSASTWNLAIDMTPPLVTINDVSRPFIGATGTSIVTWHSNENGTYSVRLGGTDCSTGTALASGNYGSAPSQAPLPVQATALAIGPNTIRVCVTDAALNTGSVATTIVKDITAPSVVSISLAGPSPTNAASVSWTVTFSEPVTGVGLSNFNLVQLGLGGAPTLTGVAGSGTSWTVTASSGTGDWATLLNLGKRTGIADLAGNPLANTLAGKIYQIDRVSPTIGVTRPAASAVYTLGGTVNASYACADELIGSGIGSCPGTSANGLPINTASVGPKTFTVTATDRAGNSTTKTVSYSVIYAFSGFFGSVANPPTLNSIKGGLSAAITFSLSGNRGLAILAAGSPSYQAINCSTRAPIGSSTPAVGTLAYSTTTGRYTYTWQTSAAWAGTCRQLTTVLNDGTSHDALFRLTN